MLREWVRNLPIAALQAIVADTKARRSAVWTLASAELLQRIVTEAEPSARPR